MAFPLHDHNNKAAIAAVRLLFDTDIVNEMC